MIEARAETLIQKFNEYSKLRKTNDYLDIGAGNLANALAFARNLKPRKTGAVDLALPSVKHMSINFVRADARALPFRDQVFDLVTMISLIEHVQDWTLCISEALRVLNLEGELFMQFPNRYFPIELHSGIFCYFYLPKKLREWWAYRRDLSWVQEIDVPSPRTVIKTLCKTALCGEYMLKGFAYPEKVLSARRLRLVHRILQYLSFFHVFPMGYLAVVHRKQMPETVQEKVLQWTV